ncbi:Predicted membrane protein [uncultured Flavonifractor sp.]|nr:Predicted membrane protein [uncultured Flavonifractor sp.]
MEKAKTNLTYLIELALLVGILLMMNITGLAMIPLPGQYASIMTVPVAVGAMMLGPLAGGVLGGVMGCISFYTAIKTGFSTLFLAGYTGGIVVVLSFINTIIPRILMGICVGWVYRAASRLDRGNTISYYIGGIAAPLLNTLFYMTVLVLIFLNAPTLQDLLGEELMSKFQDNILLFVAAYVGVQALIEAALGCVISGSVCKALHVVLKQ